MSASPLYAATDLHSDNNYLAIVDESDRVVFERRLKNRLSDVLAALEPHRDRVVAVAVESTFNWYWLVDGLMEAGYDVRLVNTTAVQQYDGLKHTDDRHDARWLAHLMRLGILPEGYIMPKSLRSLRDLLRKRMHLVRQRTANILSVQNLKQRNDGVQLSGKDVRALTPESVIVGTRDLFRAKSLATTVTVIQALDQQIDDLEACLTGAVRDTKESVLLQSIWGVGKILSMTIQLETGFVGRFKSPGNYASYCRCVKSERLSNGKVKGRGNEKCGNAYLAWAWVEAANFAIINYPKAAAFYQRKKARRNGVLARKALAHKLARAAWHVLRSGNTFDPKRVFG
jgi:transposase